MTNEEIVRGAMLLGGDDDGEFPLIGENAVLITLAMKLLEERGSSSAARAGQHR
jgi:hypothetical protein